VGMRRWANKQINLPEIEGVESACLAEAVERDQVGPHIVQPVGVGRVLVDVPRLGRWRQCSVVVVVVCTAKPREQRDVRNVVRQTNRREKVVRARTVGRAVARAATRRRRCRSRTPVAGTCADGGATSGPASPRRAGGTRLQHVQCCCQFRAEEQEEEE